MPLSADGPVATHLAEQPAEAREALSRIVDRVLELVPEVGQTVSYGLPTLTYRGKSLLSAVAATRHLALYPHSGQVVELVAPDLAGFSLSKGTIRFSAAQPIPDAVLDRIIELRRAAIDDALGPDR